MKHPDCKACEWSGVDEAEYAAWGCPDCNCDELRRKDMETVTFQTEEELKFAKSVAADLVMLRDTQHQMKFEIALLAFGIVALDVFVAILALKLGGKI